MRDIIIVTGGAGFIGANFVQFLLANKSARIITLDKLTYAGNLLNISSVSNDVNHEFVQGDIVDRARWKSLLKKYQPRAIVNFAAESHVDRSIDSPDDFIQTNIVGVFHMLDEVLSYWKSLETDEQNRFRLLHVSTDEVFGSLQSDEPAFNEKSIYAPNSPYSASKASADHLVRAYFHTYGLPVLTTNCSNNYGPYQFPEKLIPLVVLNAIAGKNIPVYGDGKNIRDWLYVTDHCSAIATVLDRADPGSTYNIGGINEKTNLQVITTLCDILDDLRADKRSSSHRDLITFVDDRPGHDQRYAIDATAIERDLNWTPRESFESGIYKTVEWYLDNLDWCNSVSEGCYQGERLGLKRQ